MSRIHDRLNVLAVPVRTRLVRLLEREELAVGEVAKVLQLPQSTVSRHLKELREVGWVVSRRVGATNLMALELDDEGEALWAVIGAADEVSKEDARRLDAVLAAREGDSRRFFGRVAGQWAELRREMFGDGFFLPAMLALLPPKSVVADLGCGTGEAAAALAPWVARVIGIDREPAMLAAASARTEGMTNVDLREGELGAPPLEPQEVDLALCMLVLHHVEEPEAVFASVADALRPDGRFVVVDMVAHDRAEYRRGMGHRHLGFSRETLEAHAERAGLTLGSWRLLPPPPEATGPGLFLASFHGV